MPPENGGYMLAAYLVTTIILVGYVWALWRRAGRALSRVGNQRLDTDTRVTPG
jgi:hypothetical protein